MSIMPIVIALVLIALLIGIGWLFYKLYQAHKLIPLAIIIAIIAFLGAMNLWLNVPVKSEIEVLNPEGQAGTALVVYHPGKSDFQKDVSTAFAEGLVSNDWRVEMTTASSQAPGDISGYDLLVLGGPIYFSRPSRPISSYLSRLGNLKGKPTVTINTAMGPDRRSNSIMTKQIEKANGDLLNDLLLCTVASNEDLYGNTDAVEIATLAGQQVPLPQE